MRNINYKDALMLLSSGYELRKDTKTIHTVNRETLDHVFSTEYKYVLQNINNDWDQKTLSKTNTVRICKKHGLNIETLPDVIQVRTLKI